MTADAARKIAFLTDRDAAADDGRMSWDFAASAEDYRKLIHYIALTNRTTLTNETS